MTSTSLLRIIKALVSDRRGEMTEHMLIMAIGFGTVAAAVPRIFNISDTVTRVFDREAHFLESASGTSGDQNSGSGAFEVSVGPDGIKASGPVGGVSASVAVSANGQVSGGLSTGSGAGGSANSGTTQSGTVAGGSTGSGSTASAGGMTGGDVKLATPEQRAILVKEQQAIGRASGGRGQ